MNSPKIVETEFLFGIMNRQAFIQYCSTDNEDSCLEIESKKLNDTELINIIVTVQLAPRKKKSALFRNACLIAS